MAGLINIDVSSLGKSISDTAVAAIKKGENLLIIQKDIEKQIQEFIGSINQGQIDLNKIDAQSGNIFKSGWRPALAWVCVAGFVWGFIVYPVTVFILKILGINQELPAINSDGLFELVLALLGMAGIRSFDKSKGLTK
jgi:hypothetical protein